LLRARELARTQAVERIEVSQSSRSKQSHRWCVSISESVIESFSSFTGDPALWHSVRDAKVRVTALLALYEYRKNGVTKRAL
jgi:hypothetical protein